MPEEFKKLIIWINFFSPFAPMVSISHGDNPGLSYLKSAFIKYYSIAFSAVPGVVWA